MSDHAAYLRAVDACLEHVAARLEPFEEIDYALSDGLLAIDFEDGARYVVNRQAAADQMWLAAGTRAWHYDWDAATGRWRDDKDGHDLYDRLGEVVSAKLGRPVDFAE